MRRKRSSEEKIIGVLKEIGADAKIANLARRHGVSEATIYNWKAKYGGLEVSEARELRKYQNARRKRLLPDAMPGRAALKDLPSEKWWRWPHGAEGGAKHLLGILSLISTLVMGWANGGGAASSMPIPRPFAIIAAGTMTLLYAIS